MPAAIDPERALDDTEQYWLEWANRCDHRGDYHEEIHQSLLLLKALTYEPTGGIVAAPTTSLPEWIGGVRNWDYRYCWLRDATLTLLAMLNSGYSDEATAWRQWLLRAVAGDPADVQIMYGVAGERRLEERVLDWLPGFEASGPVRVGNAASEQLQLDVYGEVIDALYQTRLKGAPADDNIWSLTRKLLEWLEEGWRREDAGIWEVRGPNRHFTHSKVMAWVAFDRAVREHDEFERDGPIERWRELRDEIEAEVHERAWNADKQAYSQYYGSDELDASVLLMGLVGFVSPTDERFLSTVDAIRRELTSPGSSAGTSRTPRGRSTGYRPGRASSSPARSGSPRCSPGRARSRRHASCSNASSISVTTSVFSPRNTTSEAAANSATSRKRSRTWRSSAPPSRSAKGRAVGPRPSPVADRRGCRLTFRVRCVRENRDSSPRRNRLRARQGGELRQP